LKETRASKDQEVVSKQGQFEMPFMRNFDKKTALHLCIDKKNFNSAEIILSKLCNDPIDSHARPI
jgi:ankyrin repeat protein